ncbi:MAG: pyruvate dehydrogenase (acetyl-transferring), homodimeric type, partial [Pseudomonadota bacterium]
MIPNCISYDPTFGHEVAVIIHSGLQRMVSNQEDVFFYITLMNENYSHPGLKKGTEQEILKGMYRLEGGPNSSKPRVQLMGSGTILREVIEAAKMLDADFGVSSDVWSCPSFTELRRDGMECERFNLLNPGAKQRIPFVAQQLEGHEGPVVAATDYIRLFSDQIRPYIPAGRRFTTLGTDGFGRSDTRAKLREFFEVDRRYVVIAALRGLAEEGKIKMSVVEDAMETHMAAIELKVPDIGDFKDVEIIEVLVKAGDEIVVEQSLITVESDKASMEIPASIAGIAGRIVEMRVKLGDKISEGSVLAMIEPALASAGPSAAASAPAPAPAPAPAAATPSSASISPTPSPESAASAGSTGNTAPVGPAHVSPVDDTHVVKPHASPGVRKFARELGVDLHRVRGSGPKQRITQDDVRGYVKGVITGATVPAQGGDGAALGLIAWPKVDFAKFGPIDPKPLSR